MTPSLVCHPLGDPLADSAQGAQVNREIEMYLRQKALTSQQRIVIQQQKDELDSINGALDAMIKLRGLGVFD